MRRDESYRAGGFLPDHPSKNVGYAIEYDDEALTMTYKEWDEAGALIIERPATDEDLHKFPLEGRNTDWDNPQNT